MLDDELQCVLQLEYVQDGAADFQAFLDALARILERPSKPWHLDLSRCLDIRMGAVAVITALVLESRYRGYAARVTLPAYRPELPTFFESVGLNHYLTGSAFPDVEDPENLTSPIRQYTASTFNDAAPLIALIGRHVEMSEDEVDYVRICVNEIIQNVQDHAKSPIGAVMGGLWDIQSKSIEISIVDCGDGIATTLKRRYPNLPNAQMALEHVIQGGFSAKSLPDNQGLGISNVAAISINQLSGHAIIFSEDGLAAGSSREWKFSRSLNSRFPGTGVFLWLRFGQK